MQAKLDELLLSRYQHVRTLESRGPAPLMPTSMKLNLERYAELEAKKSELDAVRVRLADAEKGWAQSKAEADRLRTQAATGSVKTDEDQVARRLMERVRAIEAEMASKRWNEKSIGEMECRNEG